MSSSTTDAVFSAVRAATPETMSREQLVEHVGQLQRLRSWLDAEDVRAARRSTALEATGRCESAESMATRNGGRSGRDARDLSRRRELCDDMPAVEAALDAGEIAAGHVDAIANAARNLDEGGLAELGDLAGALVDEAARSSVDAFGRSVRDRAASIMARRNAAQSGVDELEAQRKASKLRRWVDKTTGMHHTHLELDPIRDAKLQAAFNAELASLRAVDGTSGTPWAQMQVNAFVNAVTGDTVSGDTVADDSVVGATGTTGTAGDEPVSAGTVDRVPEITVLIDYDRLISDAISNGICETDHGVPLPVATVRRLCCDAEIIPVVLGNDRDVLDAGRSSRTANRAQRRALRAMHRGCAHPDCTAGFDACRIHHIRWWWRDNGPSDVANLLPLCERHHHLVHEGGWSLTMTPDRIATWHRPDGTVFHHGTTIDRRTADNTPAGVQDGATGTTDGSIRHAPAARSDESTDRPTPPDGQVPTASPGGRPHDDRATSSSARTEVQLELS